MRMVLLMNDLKRLPNFYFANKDIVGILNGINLYKILPITEITDWSYQITKGFIEHLEIDLWNSQQVDNIAVSQIIRQHLELPVREVSKELQTKITLYIIKNKKKYKSYDNWINYLKANKRLMAKRRG